MHIGLLTADLSHAHGWAHHCLSLAQALQRAGVQLSIITAHNSPEVAGIEAYCILPETNPMAKNLLLKVMQQAPTVGQQLRDCDLVHAMIEPYAPVGAWISGQRPFLVTAHGSYVDLLPRRRWPVGVAYRWSFRRARTIICVSQYTAGVAQRELPGVNTTVIPNGIDPERFTDLPSAGVDKTGPTILSVGAVKLRKGTLELVRAMQTIRDQMPAAQCVIIGSLDAEPGYTQQVQAEIQILGLQEHVRLLGHVSADTLIGWFGAADVFVMPSMNVGRKFEGFGLTHLEASAAGLPVIGTTDCGAEDAIVHGETGLLISQANVATELPRAILALLDDPERARQMGAAGKNHARQLTWDHTAQQLIKTYEQALRKT